jgi:AraC family ethanolamine operon transcriptional activator
VPSTPPAVTVIEITDPMAAHAGIELLAQDVIQLQSMPLRAKRVVVRLDPSTVVFHSSNLRVRTHTSVHEGLISYVVAGASAQGTINGLPVRPDVMLFAEAEKEAVFVVEPGWESVSILLPSEHLREHLAARRREDEYRLPHGIESLHCDMQRVRTLFDLGKRLVDLAQRQPAIFDSEVARASAHAELMETLLEALGGADPYEPTRDDRIRQAHGLVVKKVEEHVLAHQSEGFHVGDLCRIAATSERAVQYAFRDVMGLTPKAYLTRLRLHRVREGLQRETRGTTTVSGEALKWGFWHFGEFSRAYRDCFGELPSETLERSRGPR